MNKLTLAAAAASLFLVGATAASAVNLPFTQESGVTVDLTPANDSQTFSVGTALAGSGYFYTFTTLGTYALELTDTGTSGGRPVNNPFIVTTGAIAGSGTTVATSTIGFPSDYAFVTLLAGTYTLLVPTSTPSEGIAGTVSASAAAVPEPASWALMMIGVAGVGGFMRRRSSLPGKEAV